MSNKLGSIDDTSILDSNKTFQWGTNSTGSLTPKQDLTPDEISEKISKILPDIGIIGSTNLLKNTKSIEESKKITNNFRKGLQDNFKDKPLKPPTYDYKKSDGRAALDRATDDLSRVASWMIRAGIDVPEVYTNFLEVVRPKEVTSPEVIIETKPPLFTISGLDESGNVKIDTKTEIQLKRGDNAIKLKEEKLIGVLEKSKEVGVTESTEIMKDWISVKVKQFGSIRQIPDSEWNILNKKIGDSFDKFRNGCLTEKELQDIVKEIKEEDSDVGVHVKDGDIKVDNMKSVEMNDVNNFVGIDDRGVLRKIEIPSSVNKNAYELRQMILENALKFVQFQYDSKTINNASTDDVIDTANNFYKFVENKR